MPRAEQGGAASSSPGSELSPGVEGFGVVFIQLVGAGVDDFVFRQTVLGSAGRQLVLQRIAADLWVLQCSLPLVIASSGSTLRRVCQAVICWDCSWHFSLRQLVNSP